MIERHESALERIEMATEDHRVLQHLLLTHGPAHAGDSAGLVLSSAQMEAHMASVETTNTAEEVKRMENQVRENALAKALKALERHPVSWRD